MRALVSPALVLALLASCGRHGFDATDDAGSDDLLAGLRDGCVVALHMDEADWTTGVGNDCTLGLDGIVSGDAIPIDDGVRGRAGSFSGTGCIELDDAPSLHASTALTVSAWVYPTALDGTRPFGLVSKRVNYELDTAYSVYLWTNDHIWVDIETENDRYESPARIVNNRWQHVTIVYDGTLPANLRISGYVDGVLRFVAPETSAVISPFISPLYIGCLAEVVPSQQMVGRLDEVVIWNRALADTEIVDWYTRTRP